MNTDVWARLSDSTLSVVAFVITFLVYGTVALIVEANDYGIFLIRNAKSPRFGKLIVKFMPYFLCFFDSLGNRSNALGWWEHNQPFIRAHGRTYPHRFLYTILDITGFSGFVRSLAETLIYTCLGSVIGSPIAVFRQARLI